MTNAPMTIHTTGNKWSGSWNATPLNTKACPNQVRYVRADVSDALLAALDAIVRSSPKDGGMVRLDGEELANARAAILSAVQAPQ